MNWLQAQKRNLRINRLLKKTTISNNVDFREEVKLLQIANQELQSPEIENHLAQLRHEAFFTLEHPSPVVSWPPISEELFNGVLGIPEIDATEMNVANAHAGVFKHGSLIIRNLLPHDDVQTLASGVSSAFDAFDNAKDLHQPQSWFTPLKTHNNMGDLDSDRPWVREGGGVLAAESPRALYQLIEIFERIGVISLITEYFNERPALSVRKTTLRRTLPHTHSEFGWHQDGAFLGNGIRSLNVWVALTDCGIDSPSMDMIPRRLNELVPTGTEGAYFDWSVSPLEIDRVCLDGQPQHLIFKAGDAIIFDELNLHRTSTLPSMTETRLAIESWFFAPSCYPIDQLPILL